MPVSDEVSCRDPQPGARASCEPIVKLLPAHIRVPADAGPLRMCLKTGDKDTPVFYAAFLELADLPSGTPLANCLRQDTSSLSRIVKTRLW